MKVFSKYNSYILAVWIAMVLVTCQTYAQEVKIYATVENTGVYVGQSIIYKIVFDGASDVGEVDLQPLEKFNPQGGGTSSSTQIINGRASQKTELTYYITAQKVGEMEIPSINVTYKGTQYKTKPVLVNVLKPGSTDKMLLNMSLSEKQCYVGQPVVMRVEWIIMTEVKNAGFNIPVFNSSDFFFEDTSLKDETNRHNTHSINGVEVKLSEERRTHQGKNVAIISFEKVLIPKKSGKFKFEPASVSAAVAVGITRRRDFWGNSRYQYKQFMVSSESLNLEVLDLPTMEKPDGFYGLLGKYNISASANPTKVSVGDPITLTIKVGGNEFLKPVKWPDIENIESFKENFKIPDQRSSAVINNGYKIFTQTIRASNDEVTEIPSIPLVFFDPDSGDYRVVKSDTIKLEVAKTKILTGADVEGLTFSPLNKKVEAIKKGLSANYEGPEVLENQHYSLSSLIFQTSYFPLWFVPFLALVLSASYKTMAHTDPQKTRAKKRQNAVKKAVSLLKNSERHSNEQKSELILVAMTGFVGDWFDKVARSLTSDDCYELIAEKTGEIRLAEKYRAILADCQACRYASVQTNIDSKKVREIIDIISAIDKKMKKLL